MKTSHETHAENFIVNTDASFTDNGDALKSTRVIELPGGHTVVTLHQGKPEAGTVCHTLFVPLDMAAFVVWRWLNMSLATTQETLASPDARLIADMAAWGNRPAE